MDVYVDVWMSTQLGNYSFFLDPSVHHDALAVKSLRVAFALSEVGQNTKTFWDREHSGTEKLVKSHSYQISQLSG